MDLDKIYNDHVVLATKVRRRNKLQLQSALLGPTADPSFSMQIEDLEKEIAELSRKVKIKPEGIFIDTSVNLKDRRVLLLQVSYDISNVIMDHFSDCIRTLLEYEKVKSSSKEGAEVAEIKDKLTDGISQLWAESSALTTLFRENRLLYPKKADLAISGFNKKVFRFTNFDWLNPDEENLKDAIIEWDDYIYKAHRSIVDVVRMFIEADSKT